MDEDYKTRIEDCFQNITKLSRADTHELIEDLADENLETKPLLHYYEYIGKFKPLTIITTKLKIFENNNSSSFENNVRSVGKGEYGETFLGSISDRVFKRITATFLELIELNAFCRNVLVESFIQTVVSTDPSEFKKNICEIKGVFKDKVKSENIVYFNIDKKDRNYYVKLSTNKSLVYKDLHNMFLEAGATIQEIYLSDEANSYIIILTAPIAEATIKQLTDDTNISTFESLEVGSHSIKKITVSLYIELEKLDTTFDKYICDNNNRALALFECGTHKCITYTNFKDKYLLPLASTLEYFNKKYKFYHGDLHTGNIMFRGNTLKIIDMGKACVTYNKKTYSADISTGCKSTDLGIFLVSILEDADDIYKHVLSKLTTTTIKNLLKLTKDHNEYDIWELVKEKIETYERVSRRRARIAHGMYSWTSPWNKYPDKLLLDVILSITPEYIMEKLNSVKIHGIAARRGGSRHNRKRRRNITRKTYPSAR